MDVELEAQSKTAKQQNKPHPFKILKRLLGLSKQYILWYILLVAALLAISAFSILNTEGLRRIINAATTKNISLLRNGVLIGIVSLVSEQFIEFFRSYSGELLDFVSVRSLQSITIMKLFKAIYKKYATFHTGDLVDRIKNSCSKAQSSLNNNAVNLLHNVLLLIMIIVYLLSVNAKLTLASLAFAAVLPVIISPISKKLNGLYTESTQLGAEKSAMIQDAVQGAEIVKTYMLSDYLVDSLKNLFSRIIRNTKKLIPYESFMYSANVLVIILGDFSILGLGGYLASKGELMVGDVITFVLLYERMFQPISYIASLWPGFQESLAAAGRMFEILDLDEEEIKGCQTCIEPSSGDITFQNVKFAYNEQDNVLKNVSFSAQKGKVTAIVGPSGSGKSTLVKLALKLYTPDSGTIKFGNDDIGLMKESDWHDRLSYVSQENSLFSGSIIENIRYGKQDAPFEAVKNASKSANIDEFIESRDLSYDTLIGEKGIKLSGGERQRLTIARAILSDKEVLILDEPTSALDNENERIVMEALDNLIKDKTTLIVAHRLSTIKSADKIIYLENGEVAESGTHEELISLKGKYYTMYNTVKAGEAAC